MAEHSGHRQRIIRKLAAGGLCEHEYLELLLFNALPRRNTNDISHRLLSEFGSIRNVFNASFQRLKQVEGIGESVAAYIVCIGRFYDAYAQYESEKVEACGLGAYDGKEFLTYVKKEYAHLPYEKLDAYLLDSDGKIIGYKSHSLSLEGEVRADPDLFLEVIAKEAPSGIVLVHNHPRGQCYPSGADDKTTKYFRTLCELHNILFCDHLIYAADGIYSYAQSKRLVLPDEEGAESV